MPFIREPMAFSGQNEAEILEKMRRKLASLRQEVEVEGGTKALLLRVAITQGMIAEFEAAD
jgi:hypothetical protein